MSLVVFCTSFT